jgi:hypothetical protein
LGHERVALICDAEVAGGLCAGHMAETWQLRTADGYYGLGVPDRIRKLPWGGADGVRTISFTAARDLPWPLLGMLNVAKALIVSNEFFKNRSADGGLADVARVQVIDNPERVVPRAFLAGSAEGVADAAQASNKIFDGAKPRDVQQHSFVEGLPAPAVYEAQGEVAVTGSGDRLEFDVSGSSGHRLLVVNELYFSGWRAFVDGSETPLLAANAVMRAVVLPPSARSVVMTYALCARRLGNFFVRLRRRTVDPRLAGGGPGPELPAISNFGMQNSRWRESGGGLAQSSKSNVHAFHRCDIHVYDAPTSAGSSASDFTIRSGVPGKRSGRCP